MSISLSKADELYFDEFVTTLTASIIDDAERKQYIEAITQEAKPVYQYGIDCCYDRYMALLAIWHCPIIARRYSKSEFVKACCTK